jgi:hypothetical protein
MRKPRASARDRSTGHEVGSSLGGEDQLLPQTGPSAQCRSFLALPVHRVEAAR